MILGKVTGVVVAPQKDPELEGNRLLIVQPLAPDGSFTGSSFLTLSRVDAGEGDTVLVNREGSGARLMFGTNRIPVQAVIVGIVDRWEVAKPRPAPGQEPPHAAQA